MRSGFDPHDSLWCGLAEARAAVESLQAELHDRRLEVFSELNVVSDAAVAPQKVRL